MSTTAHLGLLDNAMKAAGQKYPAPVIKAITEHGRLMAAVQALPQVSSADITEAAALAILEDRDPLADQEVLRLTLGAQLTGDGGLRRTMAAHAEARTVRALTEHSGPVVDALAAGVERAGDQLVAAVTVLGDVNLDQSGLILSLGPVAAEHWATAKRAVQNVRVIDSGWVALAHLTRFADPGTLPVHRLADVPLDVWRQVGNHPDPWTLAQHGVRVQLATAEQAKDRTARLSEERQDYAAAPARAAKAAWARTRAIA